MIFFHYHHIVFPNIWKNSRKKKFIRHLKKNIDDEDRELVTEGFYEWTIEDWDKISKSDKEVVGPTFNVDNHEWKLQIIPNEESYSLHLHCENEDDNENEPYHICVKRAIYIRNYKSYACCYFNVDKKFKYYSNKEICNGGGLFKKIYLNDKFKKTRKSLIHNNKCIVGTYFRIYKYKQEYYKEELSHALHNRNNEVDSEGFFEWKIENWNELANIERSQEFIVGDNKWRLKLKQNNDSDNSDYICIQLMNTDIENNTLCHICTKYNLFIRNYDDATCFYNLADNELTYFNRNSTSWGFNQFIKKSDLFETKNDVNKPIIENNKCIIGTYFKIYNYKQEQYKNEIKNTININEQKPKEEGFYEWIIEDWNNLSNEEYSPEFTLGQHKWKLQLNTNNDKSERTLRTLPLNTNDNEISERPLPLNRDNSISESEMTLQVNPNDIGESVVNDNDNDFVSIYLNSIDVKNDDSTSIAIKKVLYIRNYYDNTSFVNGVKPSLEYYDKNNTSLGYNIIEISKLYSRNRLTPRSIIENNKCIVGVYLQIYPSCQEDEEE